MPPVRSIASPSPEFLAELRRRSERPPVLGEYAAPPGDTVAGRLKIARLKQGYATAKAAALALGMKVVTVYAHEGGQRGIPRLAAAAYARGYGVSVAWLLYGETEEAETRQLLSLTLRAARAEGRIGLVRETLRRLLAELDAADQAGAPA